MITFNSYHHKTDAELLKLNLNALNSVLKDKSLGFHQLPDRPNLWTTCENAAKKLRQNYSTMVVLGIGGSSLGGRVIKEALKGKTDRQVIFWDNVDPLTIDAQLETMAGKLKSVCWALISKSGNTIETLTQGDYVNQFYKSHNLKWTDHCIVVTEPKNSPLADFADTHGIPRLEVPLDVGGRFSVLTPVGMLPAAFMGLNVQQICQGAKSAINYPEAIAELAAQAEQSFSRQEWITVFWSYSDSIKEFGFWIQQRWAESLAKAENREGSVAPRASTPLPCVGPTDQHSILQQIADGAKDKFVIFLRHVGSENAGCIISESLFSCGNLMLHKKLGELLKAEAQATQMGLTQKQVSNLTMMIPTISEQELGFLFMYFELLVATIGERLDINTFNQPGVELGKLIAKDLLSKN
jgi:glucose-6-phosphate isomerase